MVAGSKYNIIVWSFVGAIVSAILLVYFRPFFVMKAAGAADGAVDEQHQPELDDLRMGHMPIPTQPEMVLSVKAVLITSVLVGVAIALLTLFTRPKPTSK